MLSFYQKYDSHLFHNETPNIKKKLTNDRCFIKKTASYCIYSYWLYHVWRVVFICNYVNLHLMSIIEAFYSYQLRYSQNRSICPFMNVQTLWAFLDFLKQLPSNANGLKCLPLLWYMIYYGRISCSVFATYRITTTIDNWREVRDGNINNKMPSLLPHTRYKSVVFTKNK